MIKPNNLILASDQATLKNDKVGSVSLYIGASSLMNYNDIYTYQSFIDIGTINSGIRCQMQTNTNGIIYNSPQIQIMLQVTVYESGNPIYVGDYYTTAYVERINSTRIRLVCSVYGYGAGVTMQITGGYQTVTADIATFLSPFN